MKEDKGKSSSLISFPSRELSSSLINRYRDKVMSLLWFFTVDLCTPMSLLVVLIVQMIIFVRTSTSACMSVIGTQGRMLGRSQCFHLSFQSY